MYVFSIHRIKKALNGLIIQIDAVSCCKFLLPSLPDSVCKTANPAFAIYGLSSGRLCQHFEFDKVNLEGSDNSSDLSDVQDIVFLKREELLGRCKHLSAKN